MQRLIKLFICCLLAQSLTAQPADLLLFNGKIFTADTAQPFVPALAIRGQTILATGTDITVLKLAGPNTRRIDLQGRTIIPGINDAHDHIGHDVAVGRFLTFNEPMLAGPSLPQLLDSLAAAVRYLPPGTMVRGHLGLRIIEDASARRAALDRVSPHHPVLLNAPWGHGTLLNTAALRLLGISDTEADPVGGQYERLPGTDSLSGLLKEYAEFGIQRRWHATLPDSVLVAAFRRYGENAARFGITSVQHMATSLDLGRTVSILQQADLPQRVRVIRFPGTTARGRELAAWSAAYPSTPRLEVSGMKWILDATPLERGAFMRAAYSDRPGAQGRLNLPVDTVRALLREGRDSREQLLLHIVGDSTPALVLDEMIRVGDAAGWRDKRLRFEHADGLMANQWEKAKSLGVVAVVNPTHFGFAEVNVARVGPERAATYQPFRSLMEAGIPVAIGSDGPNNPFLNIMLAAIHPTNPREAVTVEQAVRAYTTGSAYAENAEKKKGKLVKGMLADLAVLSQDIFTVPLQGLPDTQSVLTIVGGKVVYEK